MLRKKQLVVWSGFSRISLGQTSLPDVSLIRLNHLWHRMATSIATMATNIAAMPANIATMATSIATKATEIACMASMLTRLSRYQ